MKGKAVGHEATRIGRGPVRLGKPEIDGRNTSGQRPNDRAVVVLQDASLELRTRVVGEVGGSGRVIARPPVQAFRRAPLVQPDAPS